MKVKELARLCHEANRDYCRIIGDNSQRTWMMADKETQRSAINGVRFHLTHRNATVRSSHNNWMSEKIKAGWKYGRVKDAEKKTHPCILPYNQLPESQQVKDYLFKGIVDSLRKFVEEKNI